MRGNDLVVDLIAERPLPLHTQLALISLTYPELGGRNDIARRLLNKQQDLLDRLNCVRSRITDEGMTFLRFDEVSTLEFELMDMSASSPRQRILVAGMTIHLDRVLQSRAN